MKSLCGAPSTASAYILMTPPLHFTACRDRPERLRPGLFLFDSKRFEKKNSERPGCFLFFYYFVFFFKLVPSQKWWGTYIYKRWMIAWKERTGKGCSTVRIRGYPQVPARPSARSLRVWSSRAPAAARRPSKAIMDIIERRAEKANWWGTFLWIYCMIWTILQPVRLLCVQNHLSGSRLPRHAGLVDWRKRAAVMTLLWAL